MTRSSTTIRWALAAALMLALAACAPKRAAESPRAQARTVSVVPVTLRPIAGGLTASGILTPREEVAVSPDISGYRVTKVLVEEGAWVRAGQPLAELDDTLLRAELQQEQALSLQQKEAADRADAEAARVKGLDGQGVLSQEQIDARRFSARGARAAAVAQDALAKQTQTRLDHLIIRAPVDGLIIQRTVRPGDLSGASTTPWFRMARDGQIELFAQVGEQDFGQIRLGMPVKISLADGSTADGQVRLISPLVDATTRLGTVRISLPVSPNIRTGGFANAAFIDANHPVPTLPESAIRYDANGASVMLVGADDRVSQVPVHTGQRGGGYVQLTDGPPPGAKVVERAAAQLLPGDYVAPLDAGTGAAP